VRRRSIVWLSLVFALGAEAPVSARPTLGEYVRAVRALEEWRIEDAELLVSALQSQSPDEPETRGLVAELAFLGGDYARARDLLAASVEPRARPVSPELGLLAESTEEATRGYARRSSSGGHFEIAYLPGKDEVLVDLAGEALELAYQRIGEDLGYTPPSVVRVEILPRVRDLARVSTLTEKEIETSGTIALCKYNKLMIVSPRATLLGYPWLDTLAHEYTHFVVARASHDRVPIWLQEGIAKFEERRWRAEPGQGGMGPVSEHFLALALKKGRLVSFEEMHPSMAKLPSQAAAATAFAEVYTMVAWLHEQVGYAGIRAVLCRIRDGRTERRALAEELSATWDEVQARWKTYLRKLDLKVDAGDRKRSLRFRRGDDEPAEDGLSLSELREDKARRFARLGGLLRARGRLVPAAMEYEKALALEPKSALVAARLSRTYLELGDAKKAIQVALPLAERDETDAGPQATLGAAYLQTGEYERAREHLVRAVRVSPFDPSVRCGLGEVYTSLGDETRAAREKAACHALGR
jgi:thioredoxin-like negative regulator of GroEL